MITHVPPLLHGPRPGRLRAVAVLAVCLLWSPQQALALQGASQGTAEIASIRFEGNATLSTAELRGQLSTQETPGFFSKFLHKTISEKLGRKDEFLSTVSLAADLERLKKYYENRGFRGIAIDTALAFSPDGSSVDITFRIGEGYRSIIDSLDYGGIPRAPETIWQDIKASPRIARGDPFNSLLLEDEVKRVLRIFADNGFPNAAFVRDSSRAQWFASSPNFKVGLNFRAGKRYRFGTVSIEQEVDTLRGLEHRDDITDDILLRHLDYRQGDYYSQALRQSSERNLNRLGLFDLRRIDVAIPPNNDSAITVQSHIVIRPKDKHELAPELIVSNENEAFNLGTGLGYVNRNFFGGARILSANMRFRTQTLGQFPNYFASNSDAVSNFDVTFEVLQPYIFSNSVKGTWSFSYIVDKQKPYKLNIVRNRFGINDRFAEFTTGQFDWTLETFNLRTREIPMTDISPDDLRQLQLLQVKPRQFNSVFSFTIQRDMTNDIFSPSDGFVHSVTLMESGILPLALRRQIGLPFTQFVSASMLGRWYFDISGGRRYSILALKLRGGVEEKYGQSRSDDSSLIPQTYRFYAGGSGSVRGWASRSLISNGDPQLGGNLSFEGSMELRTNLLQNLRDGLLDKIWVVQFLDFGNLWPTVRDFRLRDVAIAAGLGFRYDTFFGPFRIDWGFRIYNPDDPSGRFWITQRQLLGQTLKEGVFHFGIGHAF